MDVPTKNLDQRDALIARLGGQSIKVPDILSTIYNNPKIRVADVDHLRQHHENWLCKYVHTESQRNKQRRVNALLITSYFYCRVPTQKLPTLLSAIAWVFIWDDEVDCGFLTNDQTKLNAYYDDSISFIRHCMQPELNIKAPPPGRLHNCESFVEIGRAMQTGQSKADLDRYVDALINFINTVRVSQTQWQSNVPSIEDFIERRIKTIEVIPNLLPLVWAYELKLPEWIWNSAPMQRMVREICIQAAMWNDIYSLKKELAANEMDNIIPILVYHHDISAQEAVDMAVEVIDRSYGNFCVAVECLKGSVSEEITDVRRDLDTWVDGCLDMLFGHVAWSIQVPRYLPRSVLTGGAGFKTVL